MRCERTGFAKRIKFEDITTDLLFRKLTDLLENPSYTSKANQVAQVFQDNPIHPMETAIYHIEYVIRHKGANYLKSAATELWWYERILLDVAVCFIALISVAIFLTYGVLKTLLKLLGFTGKTKKPKMKTS